MIIIAFGLTNNNKIILLATGCYHAPLTGETFSSWVQSTYGAVYHVSADNSFHTVRCGSREAAA
jgi:hypothetical protein